MSEVTKLTFGNIDDNDESLKGKAPSGVFGLNTGNVTKFAFNTNAGENNSPGNAVDISIKLGDREMNTRVYEVTRVYDRNNNQITDTESDEYIKGYNESSLQNMAVIVHAAKALGVTSAQLEAALATPKANFKEWAETVIGLVPANFAEQTVDVFLEYQWNISKDQTRTFLQIPRNMKGGRFLCPSIAPQGSWEEEREWVDEKGKEVKGLRYKDKGGNIHPFTRSQNFMESPKAYLQDEEAQGPAVPTAGVTNSGNQKKETW